MEMLVQYAVSVRGTFSLYNDSKLKSKQPLENTQFIGNNNFFIHSFEDLLILKF